MLLSVHFRCEHLCWKHFCHNNFCHIPNGLLAVYHKRLKKERMNWLTIWFDSLVLFPHWCHSPTFISYNPQPSWWSVWRHRVEPVFPVELWNIYRRTWDSVPRTDNHVEGFPNTIHSSVPDMHPCLWKLVPPLVKGEILTIKEKVQCWGRGQINKQERYDTMNKRLWRQVPRNSPQNKPVISVALPWVYTTQCVHMQVFLLHTKVFLILLFIFNVSLCPFSLLSLFKFFMIFIFHDGKIALWPIKLCSKNFLGKKCLWQNAYGIILTCPAFCFHHVCDPSNKSFYYMLYSRCLLRFIDA